VALLPSEAAEALVLRGRAVRCDVRLLAGATAIDELRRVALLRDELACFAPPVGSGSSMATTIAAATTVANTPSQAISVEPRPLLLP
jgi:hypothetical protein